MSLTPNLWPGRRKLIERTTGWKLFAAHGSTKVFRKLRPRPVCGSSFPAGGRRTNSGVIAVHVAAASMGAVVDSCRAATQLALVNRWDRPLGWCEVSIGFVALMAPAIGVHSRPPRPLLLCLLTPFRFGHLPSVVYFRHVLLHHQFRGYYELGEVAVFRFANMHMVL